MSRSVHEGPKWASWGRRPEPSLHDPMADIDLPCEVCGGDPAGGPGGCDCPECPVCGASGDPKCYKEHGLRQKSPAEEAGKEEK